MFSGNLLHYRNSAVGFVKNRIAPHARIGSGKMF